MLPYFAFHLRILASLMPCLRRKSATETLASCFFNIPMIYSSEKRLRFMLLSFAASERSSNWIEPKGQGHHHSRRNSATSDGHPSSFAQLDSFAHFLLI
jgi:hypothetical protein